MSEIVSLGIARLLVVPTVLISTVITGANCRNHENGKRINVMEKTIDPKIKQKVIDALPKPVKPEK